MRGLRGVGSLDHRNLDEAAERCGRNTTTECMAFHIHSLPAEASRGGVPGGAGRRLSGLEIALRQSPDAPAAFEGPIG